MRKKYLYISLGVVLILLMLSLSMSSDSTKLLNFQAYFDTYLSSGDEVRDSKRVDEVPLGFERVKFEGEFVGIEFEAITHHVFVLAETDWYTKGNQDFYFELERPSACYSQVLFGAVEADECDEIFVSEYFGPFKDNVTGLISEEAFFTIERGE